MLLGPGAVAPYAGYDPSVDPGLANVFSTAAYRVGHSMVTAELLRLGPDFEPLSAGHVALRDAFFAPWALDHEGVGIEAERRVTAQAGRLAAPPRTRPRRTWP